MTYAVHHVDAEGRPQLEDVASLETALARVENLRNDAAATEVRVFKEVPIEVRTYYRVVAVEESVPQAVVAPAAVEAEEVAGLLHATVPSEPPSGAMVIGPPPAAARPETGEDVAEPTQEHRRVLFGRS